MGRGDLGRWAIGALLALLWCGAPACRFDTGGGAAVIDDDPDAMPGVPDAATPDATVPIECEAGEPLCAGHAIELCNESGDGYVPAEHVLCPLSCEPGGGDPYCTAPSNIEPADALACDGDAVLMPGAGATVTVVLSGGVEQIQCSPDCGQGQTKIDRAGVIDQTGSEVAWFCLSSMSIPAGVNVVVSSAVTRSIAFLVDGDATIAGTISLQGRAAVADATGATTALGQGGPGGFDGGDVSGAGVDGEPGGGTCGGGPGKIQNSQGPAGSGGGGGGHAATGGDGGDGKSNGTGGNGNDGTIVDGGSGGDDTCDGDGTLIPLRGGAGGGGGADGSCNAKECGWPGGGGGGAVQISSRGDLTVSGLISAAGGAGGSLLTGDFVSSGAGGGGAGGAVLLEGSRLILGGASVLVIGGGGGAAGAGGGGAGGGVGAQVGMLSGQSVGTVPDDHEGGAGGGGAAGQVRLNAATAPTCGALATPPSACSSGVIADAP